MRHPPDPVGEQFPRVPEWAIDGGCPPPEADEKYRAYVTRIGLDYHKLTADLTRRTAPVAHTRLMHALADRYPEAWQQQVKEFVRAHARVTNRDDPADL